MPEAGKTKTDLKGTPKIAGLKSILPERTDRIYIIGADSFLGIHFAMHWFAHDHAVDGCGKSQSAVSFPGQYSVSDYRGWNIPDKNYSWLMLCHDPRTGYEEHIALIRSLCEYLLLDKRSIRICYLSSAAICASSGRAIRETTGISPHNALEVTIASAEHWLQAYCCQSDGRLLPFIFRLGDIYGNELGIAPACGGLVNRYIRDAIAEKTLSIPGLGNTYRSLSHIGDVCEAVIQLMTTDVPPHCVNIPGERYSMIDIAVAVSERFGNEISMSDGNEFGDDYSPCGGHRNLSGSLFKKIVNFTPTHSFKKWLTSVPAPADLGQDGIT